MKKIVLLLVSLALCAGVSAQQRDARQRTVDTIVADVLAQMPSGNADAFAAQMADLAGSAPASVTELAKFLPKASPARAEYALDGLVSYVSARPAQVRPVAEGLHAAMAAEPAARPFLLSCLARIAGPADVARLAGYAADKALAPTALSTLAALPEGKDALMGLLREGKADRDLLCGAAVRAGLEAAEPVLLGWEPSEGVCQALAAIGSEASLPLLKAQSPQDYVRLLGRLADQGKTKVALKGAKELLAAEDVPLRTAATAVALRSQDARKALPLVDKILQDPSREYRVAALSEAGDALGAGAVAARIEKKFARLSPEAAGDVLQWAGLHEVMPGVVRAEAMKAHPAAIEAAGRMGQADVLLYLAAGGNEDAFKALQRVKGDIRPALKEAIEKTPYNVPLLRLAGERRLTDAAPQAIAMVASPDAMTHRAGLEVLPDLAAPAVAPQIAALLDDASAADVPALTKAFSNAIRTLDGPSQYKETAARINTAVNPERFYPALAQSGTQEAVDKLAANGSRPEARQALMAIDNPAAAPQLLRLSETAPEKNALLSRYAALVGRYESNPDKKRLELADALGRSSDALVREAALGEVARIPTMKAFLLAGKYLDSNASIAAADAVRAIAAKTTEEIDYAYYKEYLEKAKAIYAARGGADDGYAVDQINGLLAAAEPAPIFVLPADEAAQGFEILFDGTSLDKWQGDKEGYTPVNGCIFVSAGYGASGNLYTIKEYRNFVFRFEFCFLEEGVNNGVGIRTPMGVDAAFEAMCECQILDHDAPMYANLNDYQVHGSAYGVVPAKRLKHKPLGEWSTEEIRVEGDRIKCTVNGEVILDANLRKACQGHNVAPDGSNNNPYTVDHRNHPGMFRERGFISFCGHGSGLKFRNIRVLDLDAKKKK